MNRILSSALVLVGLVAALLAGGCSSSGSSPSSAPPVSVTITNKFTAINAGAAAVTLNATVQNDPANKGVNWMITAGGAACSPACGTLSSSTSTSVVYTPPATAPAAPANAPTITATSAADVTKSDTNSFTINTAVAACGSGNESKMSGSYAFLMQGFNSSGYVALAGQFTADGTGKITAGQEDIDTPLNVTNPQVTPVGSSYSLGADDRGCLTLATAAGSTIFRFALGASNGSALTKGHIIEFDDTTGYGQRGAGIIRLQDSTAFSTAKVTGNYAFGASGVDSNANRFAIAGVADLSTGTVTGGMADADVGGAVLSDQGITSGTYSINSATGRGTLSFVIPGPTTIDFAIYVVSSSEVIVMTTDPISATNAIAVGEARQQSGTFAQASLSGSIVLHDTGLSPMGPLTVIGLLSADGMGGVSGPTFHNVAGTFGTATLSETYIVASDGRVTLSGGSTPPVFYLYGTNQGFEVGTGPDSSFGFLENQIGGPFSNASFSGVYFFGVEDPSSRPINIGSGGMTANGSNSSPAITGTIDESNLLGLAPNVPLTASYSIASDGVGSITVSGSPTTNTAIMISPTKLVFFGNDNRNPAVFVVEQ